MRTTLTLDDDVAARLRALCRRTGESFKAVVNRVLREGLYAPRARRPEEPFHVDARPLHVRPGISIDDVAGLLEQVDGPEHR